MFTVRHDRNHGICHTCAKAVPPAEVWPMIARGVDRGAVLAGAAAQVDMHMVEISSAKRLTVGDTGIQRNHITNEFRACFDNKTGVAQFWRWEGPQIRPGSTPF